MDLTSSSPDSPREQARALMQKKENIESEIQANISILEANSSTMTTPLVDNEGFPRADIDIWAVRTSRVRIIELRNDLKAVMDEIAKSLERIYSVSSASNEPSEAASSGSVAQKPFARVDGVSPESPAAEAVSPFDAPSSSPNLPSGIAERRSRSQVW
jgi:26S proteasome regulatory subunit N4